MCETYRGCELSTRTSASYLAPQELLHFTISFRKKPVYGELMKITTNVNKCALWWPNSCTSCTSCTKNALWTVIGRQRWDSRTDPIYLAQSLPIVFIVRSYPLVGGTVLIVCFQLLSGGRRFVPNLSLSWPYHGHRDSHSLQILANVHQGCFLSLLRCFCDPAATATIAQASKLAWIDRIDLNRDKSRRMMLAKFLPWCGYRRCWSPTPPQEQTYCFQLSQQLQGADVKTRTCQPLKVC